METLIVFLAITFGIYIMKICGSLLDILLQDNIKNKKIKKKYLEERYKKEYPKNKGLHVKRPHKKNDPWNIFINIKEIPWFSGDIDTHRIEVFFFKESDDQIKFEKKYHQTQRDPVVFFGGSSDFPDEKILSVKYYDNNYNEVLIRNQAEFKEWESKYK